MLSHNSLKTIREHVRDIGFTYYFRLFIFQKIFRFNAHVPWPVHPSSIVSSPEKIFRETNRPYLGLGVGSYIQAMNGIYVGRNTRVGPGVKIISANHNIYDFDRHDPAPPIKIGDNCWIGANAVILPGVELGDHIIVAAGSVVNKSFLEGNCVIGGVPAKFIKKIGEYGEEPESNSHSN